MFLNIMISSIITFQTWKKLTISCPFVEAWTYKRRCIKTLLKVTTLYSPVSPTMCNRSKKISRLISWFKWSNNKTNNKDWSGFCRKKLFGSYRSSLSQMFYKIGDFKNFAKLIRKHLFWSWRLVSRLKAEGLHLYQKKTPSQAFSCEFWKIRTHHLEHHWAIASDPII